MLDVYDGTSGAYRYSVVPPHLADFVAESPGGFVLGGEASDGSPFVARFHLMTRSTGATGSVDPTCAGGDLAGCSSLDASRGRVAESGGPTVVRAGSADTTRPR